MTEWHLINLNFVTLVLDLVSLKMQTNLEFLSDLFSLSALHLQLSLRQRMFNAPTKHWPVKSSVSQAYRSNINQCLSHLQFTA